MKFTAAEKAAAVRRHLASEDPLFPLKDIELTELLRREGINLQPSSVSYIRQKLGVADWTARLRAAQKPQPKQRKNK